jgi:resuscitation-promoting factor RpfA
VASRRRWRLTDPQRLVIVLAATFAAFLGCMAAGMGSPSLLLIALLLVVGAGVGVFLLGLRRTGQLLERRMAQVVRASPMPAGVITARCAMELLVRKPGQPSVGVRVRESRVPVSKWPLPGMILPVDVVARNPKQLRIRWELVMPHAGRPVVPVAQTVPFFTDYAEGVPRPEGATPVGPDQFGMDPRLAADLDALNDPDALADYAGPADLDPAADPGVDFGADLDGDQDWAGERTTVLDPDPIPPGDVLDDHARWVPPMPPFLANGSGGARGQDGGEDPTDPGDETAHLLGPTDAGTPGTPPLPAPEVPWVPGWLSSAAAGMAASGLEPSGMAERGGAELGAVGDVGLDETGTGTGAAGVGVMLIVSDLDRSIRFYRDTLGFTVVGTAGGRAVLEYAGGRIVLRRVADMSPVDRRVAHVQLKVSNVDDAYRRLVARGVEFVHRPQESRVNGLVERTATFRDPDGHAIAITEWHDELD